MTLERIIRPFQRRDVFKSRRLAPGQPAEADSEEEEIAQLIWQGGPDTNHTDALEPGYLGFTTEWVEDKERRVTETVRIENEQDPEQFVEVERIKQMVMKNTNTSEELPIKMDWGT